MFLKIVFIITIFLGVKFLLEWSLKFIVNQRVTIELKKTDPSLDFQVGSIYIHLLNPGLSVKQILLKKSGETGVKVGKLDVSTDSWLDLFLIAREKEVLLEKAQASVAGLVISPQLFGANINQMMKTIGLFDLKGSLKFQAKIDSRQGHLDINSLSFNFPELFDFQLSADFSGMNLKSDNVEKVIKDLVITNFNLSYFDRSFMGRALSLETFPEFEEMLKKMKSSMNKAETEKKELVNPVHAQKVFVSEESNNKIKKLFIHFMLKPNRLTVFLDDNKSILASELPSLINKKIEVRELLNQLGIKVRVEPDFYL